VRKHYDGDTGKSMLTNLKRQVVDKLALIEDISFEGKGGTTEDKEQRNFLSGLVVSIVHLALDSLNFLISLTTFGATDKFFRKTPTEAEVKVITEQWDALVNTNISLMFKFITLKELKELKDQNIVKDDNTPGLG